MNVFDEYLETHSGPWSGTAIASLVVRFPEQLTAAHVRELVSRAPTLEKRRWLMRMLMKIHERLRDETLDVDVYNIDVDIVGMLNRINNNDDDDEDVATLTSLVSAAPVWVFKQPMRWHGLAEFLRTDTESRIRDITGCEPEKIKCLARAMCYSEVFETADKSTLWRCFEAVADLIASDESLVKFIVDTDRLVTTQKQLELPTTRSESETYTALLRCVMLASPYRMVRKVLEQTSTSTCVELLSDIHELAARVGTPNAADNILCEILHYDRSYVRAFLQDFARSPSIRPEDVFCSHFLFELTATKDKDSDEFRILLDACRNIMRNPDNLRRAFSRDDTLPAKLFRILYYAEVCFPALGFVDYVDSYMRRNSQEVLTALGGDDDLFQRCLEAIDDTMSISPSRISGAAKMSAAARRGGGGGGGGGSRRSAPHHSAPHTPKVAARKEEKKTAAVKKKTAVLQNKQKKTTPHHHHRGAAASSSNDDSDDEEEEEEEDVSPSSADTALTDAIRAFLPPSATEADVARAVRWAKAYLRSIR